MAQDPRGLPSSLRRRLTWATLEQACGDPLTRYQKLFRRYFNWFDKVRQRLGERRRRRCYHPPNLVVADVLEGDGGAHLSWCRLCGSLRRYGKWRVY